MRYLFAAVLVPGALFAQGQAPLSEAQTQFFETNIRPVLAQDCATCHNDAKMGGLSVLSRADLLKGGVSGAAVIPGEPDKSLLIAKLREGDQSKRMPKASAPLKDDEINALVVWVRDGAYWPPEGQSTEAKKKFFNESVRPVIAFQCFSCHSTSKMGGLELDTREGMLKGGKSGPALVPGDPDKSLLITAVRRTNPGLLMPKNGSPLSAAQLGALTKWVKDGAIWPEEAREKTFTMTAQQRELWSVQPLKKPAVPKVRDAAWPMNDIDKFVLAKLEAEGMTPAPMASRQALLRRASYDLIGLPPTYEEVKAFESDRSPNAWEKQIDRLLASPQYGEKWARHWMDLVRYSEDDYGGGGADRAIFYKFAYTYRDWLIKAFNDGMPYGDFVRMQLAGDMMDPKVRDKALPALGMNGLGVWNYLGMPEIERTNDWHDRVDVTSKAFLGLTVGCARCHDHKYDAIPTKDYYRMAGVFASSSYRAYPLAPQPVVNKYEGQQKELQEKQNELKELTDRASELQKSVYFLQTESYMVAAWRVGGEKDATVEAIASQYKLDKELLQRWIRFLKKPPNNYGYLKPWQAMVQRGGTLEEAQTLAHEFYQTAQAVVKEKLKIKQDNEVTLAKTTDPNAKELFDPLPNDRKRVLNIYLLELKGIEVEKGQLWTDMFETDLGDPNKIGEAPEGRRGSPGLLEFTDKALEKRLPAEWAAQMAHMKADIDAFKKSMGEHYPFAYGIGEAEKPVDLHVMVRGNPAVSGEEAPRAFLAMLSDGPAKPFTNGSGRLELANDMLEQPVAMRVIANRIWGWVMGSPIVLTASNFGIAGSGPSNQELLEYLTLQFMDGGMSFRKLQKMIMMSRTYQLSAEPNEANLAKDSDNRFYWRANTKRLEAEGVWDYLLSASGQIDLKTIGGPSRELEDGMTRRGVYGVSSRMFPNNFLLAFDFITPTISVERRLTTTTPQQRLFFLNNPIVHKQAEALADRVSGERVLMKQG